MKPLVQRSVEERNTERVRILSSRPNHIPILVSRGPTLFAPRLAYTQFLVPETLSVAQFVYALRRRLKVLPEQSIFISCGRTMLDANNSMYQVYAKHKNLDDGLLYIVYSTENAFG